MTTSTNTPTDSDAVIDELLAGLDLPDNLSFKHERLSQAKAAIQKLLADAQLEARLDEQKLVTEWLIDAEHVETIKDFNQLRRLKLGEH